LLTQAKGRNERRRLKCVWNELCEWTLYFI